MTAMQIRDSQPRWGVVWLVFLVLALAAGLPFILFQFQSTKDLPKYEVQNFIGKVEVYSSQSRSWRAAQRGERIEAGDKIRTSAASEIDIRVPDQIRIRVKENSEIVVKKPSPFDHALRYRLHLTQGALLGATDKKFEGQKLEITTPVLVAAVRGTTFQIEANPETHDSAVRVLEGTINVKSLKTHKSVTVHSLEKTEIKGKQAPTKPARVSREEWNRLKEGYELFEKSAATEAKQMDLSKLAGNLFQFVFDHGTFYTPNFGFADREFIPDEKNGTSYLKISYDVFPAGSFVGVYNKVRKLDMQKFKSFEFQARGNPEEGYPLSAKIEIKSGSGIVRAFVPRDFTEKWQSYQFPLRFSRPAAISEITIVFANEKVGDAKKGSLYLRDFKLVPADVVPPAPASAGAPGAVKTAKTASAVKTFPATKATRPAGTKQSS